MNICAKYITVTTTLDRYSFTAASGLAELRCNDNIMTIRYVLQGIKRWQAITPNFVNEIVH